jgi:hypothetical protein
MGEVLSCGVAPNPTRGSLREDGGSMECSRKLTLLIVITGNPTKSVSTCSYLTVNRQHYRMVITLYDMDRDDAFSIAYLLASLLAVDGSF